MSSIEEMPQAVKSEYIRAVKMKRPENWLSIVRLAIKMGVTDPDKLADIPFFLYRPNMVPRRLKKGETELIKAWIATRNNLVDYIKAVQISLRPPELRRWLELLDVDHIRARGHHSEHSQKARRAALERMRIYLAKAAAEPHVYSCVYRRYEYFDG